jgi:tRNA(fMet)-specific endonuclease VapC
VSGVLVDTSAYRAASADDPQVKAALRAAGRVCVNPVILAELLFGFDNGNRATANRGLLRQFLNAERVEVLPIIERTAAYWVLLRRQLKARGRPIPANDMWIAATALEHGLTVLTTDAHFREVGTLLVARAPGDIFT